MRWLLFINQARFAETSTGSVHVLVLVALVYAKDYVGRTMLWLPFVDLCFSFRQPDLIPFGMFISRVSCMIDN